MKKLIYQGCPSTFTHTPAPSLKTNPPHISLNVCEPYTGPDRNNKDLGSEKRVTSPWEPVVVGSNPTSFFGRISSVRLERCNSLFSTFSLTNSGARSGLLRAWGVRLVPLRFPPNKVERRRTPHRINRFAGRILSYFGAKWFDSISRLVRVDGESLNITSPATSFRG